MAYSRWQRRLRAACCVVLLVVSCESAPEQRIRKSTGVKKAVCTDKDQKKMSDDFNQCINKFTQIHHENMGRSMSAEDSQRFTCQMLADTVNCGSVWKDCHTAAEVRSIKDSHIAARINQFAGAKDGGVDINDCEVVKEYVESGRAEQVQHTTEGSCTNREVTAVQGAFQSCSHNLSTVAWDKIKDLQDSRRLTALEGEEDETNDILEEEERLDGGAGLVGDDELRPMLCSTLMDIGNKCVLSITKCFSREDINLMRDQHMHTMAGYYSSLYDNIDLSSCTALTAFAVDNVSADDYDDYNDDEYYDSYEDYNEDEDQVQAPEAPSTTTTTTEPATTTTTPTTPAAPSEPEHQKRAPSQLPVSSDEMPASGAPAVTASPVSALIALALMPVLMRFR